MDAPIITIFVRHSLDCKHADEISISGVDCWKHLRWSYDGKQHRRAAKCKTWAGAERVKREIELSYETAGKPVEPDRPATVRQAVETFIHDKQGQNLNAGVIGKFRRELGRLVEFCEHRGKFYLPEVALARPDGVPVIVGVRLSFIHHAPEGSSQVAGILPVRSKRGIHSAQPRRRYVSHQGKASSDAAPHP